MPQTLVDDDSSFPTSVTVPSGTDARTAASVKTPFQALANRAAYLRKVLETLGVIRIREVADLAALAALDDSGMTVGELRLVPGYGVYRLTSGTTTASPWRVAALSGTRWWVHELNALRGASAGLATLSGGRLVEPPPYAPLEILADQTGTTLSTNQLFPRDVASSELTFVHPAAAGDLLLISYTAYHTAGGSGKDCRGSVFVSENGGAYAEFTVARSPGIGGTWHRAEMVYTVGVAGPIKAKFCGGRATDAGGANDDLLLQSFVCKLVRP